MNVRVQLMPAGRRGKAIAICDMQIKRRVGAKFVRQYQMYQVYQISIYVQYIKGQAGHRSGAVGARARADTSS